MSFSDGRPSRALFWAYASVVILLAILILGLLLTQMYHDKVTDYEMDNGVICDSSTGNTFTGSKSKFYDCSDGKVYVKPHSYKEITEFSGGANNG